MADRPAGERREELIALYREMSDCHDCPLAGSRSNLVFGSGNADADLMFVGEAPGFYEDRQGRPFVGRAGKLLDELLAEVGLDRDDVFITNVLKCRPPDNRDPLPDEIEVCSPYLHRQVALIAPRVICTLGNFATRLLTGRREGITKVHGVPQTRELGGRTVRLYPIFHPAAALRTAALRVTLQEDFARLRALLEEEPPGPPPGQAHSAGQAGEGGSGNGLARAGPPSDQLGLFQ